MKRKESDRCGNCLYYDGEPEDETRLCDQTEREVSKNWYCYMHKRRVGDGEE